MPLKSPPSVEAVAAFVEKIHIRDFWLMAARLCLTRQKFHDGRDIQTLWAARGARLACGAKPGRFGFQRDIFLPELHSSHDLVRLPVKV